MGDVDDSRHAGREIAPRGVESVLGSIVALGQSLDREFDPTQFLAEFSRCIQPLLPHDRLVMGVFSDDNSTLTIFAEHVGPTGRIHEGHYSTLSSPRGLFLVSELVHPEIAKGVIVRDDDMQADTRYANAPGPERRVVALGLRSQLIVPFSSGGQTVGFIVGTSLEPGQYTAHHERVMKDLMRVAGPFLHVACLLQREIRRRLRHAEVERLSRTLASTLDLREVFEGLASAIQTVLDFDAVGISLLDATGRNIENLVEIDKGVEPSVPIEQAPIDAFSFGEAVLAGKTVVVRDARVELDRSLPGDEQVVADGFRACLFVPLILGDRVGGALYFAKRRPNWYDSTDEEVAQSIALQIALVIQHSRQAQQQKRIAETETRARMLEKRVERLESELDLHFGFDRIIGHAPALREALAGATKVASTDTTVLVTGESGTGKELVAHAIHSASPRARGPFVAINCAALPEQLIESELFGHEKGAFTGADRARVGRFELAAGGTLFLDEIGDLAPAVQAKILRVLQEREFTRIGASKVQKADVRLIAATNRDLRADVEAQRFREDLYYRLSVFSVHMPPLRERGDDVLILAEHFLRGLGAKMGKNVPGLARDARDALMLHTWPGNIRELSNTIERALILSDGGPIRASQLGLPPPGERASGADATHRLSDLERQAVEGALARAKGNRSRAAQLLGVTRSQLYTRLKRFGMG
jgi:transcriptional regulator with GAF, ATPase, and Fis domain